MKGQRVEAAVRALCQTGVPGPVQRVSAVVSDRHASDRCAEHLRDARDRYRLVLKVGHEELRATVQCVDDYLAIGRAGDLDPAIGQVWGQPPAALLRVLRPGQEFGQHPPASSASETRDSGSSARHGPNIPFSVASISSAPAVSTCSQPPSQGAPTSTPGTLGALLMRYPSQTCVRLAPQRRNSPTATLVRDWQTITSRPAGRVLSPSLTGRRNAACPPEASRVRNSDRP